MNGFLCFLSPKVERERLESRKLLFLHWEPFFPPFLLWDKEASLWSRKQRARFSGGSHPGSLRPTRLPTQWSQLNNSPEMSFALFWNSCVTKRIGRGSLAIVEGGCSEGCCLWKGEKFKFKVHVRCFFRVIFFFSFEYVFLVYNWTVRDPRFLSLSR